jgi:hypothetical protein
MTIHHFAGFESVLSGPPMTLAEFVRPPREPTTPKIIYIVVRDGYQSGGSVIAFSNAQEAVDFASRRFNETGVGMNVYDIQLDPV